MLWYIISGIVGLLWIYLLFAIGQLDKKVAFFLMLYIPSILTTGLYLIVLSDYLVSIALALSVWMFFLIAIVVLERIAWGIALKEISGRDKLVTFYLVYMFPVVGWIVYYLTRLDE